MKAVRCHRFAGLDQEGRPVATPDPLREVLALDEIAPPECGEGHVLVRTHYAGVQYPDALQAQGLYQHKPSLPYVPGMDLTGTVLEAGASVAHLEVGQRVIALVELGGLAEVVSVPAESVWKARTDCISRSAPTSDAIFSPPITRSRTSGRLVRAISC